MPLMKRGPSGTDVCYGTFLSRNQFISDLEVDRFADARLRGRGVMTAEEIEEWTAAGATEQRNR